MMKAVPLSWGQADTTIYLGSTANIMAAAIVSVTSIVALIAFMKFLFTCGSSGKSAGTGSSGGANSPAKSKTEDRRDSGSKQPIPKEYDISKYYPKDENRMGTDDPKEPPKVKTEMEKVKTEKEKGSDKKQGETDQVNDMFSGGGSAKTTERRVTKESEGIVGVVPIHERIRTFTRDNQEQKPPANKLKLGGDIQKLKDNQNK